MRLLIAGLVVRVHSGEHNCRSASTERLHWARNPHFSPIFGGAVVPTERPACRSLARCRRTTRWDASGLDEAVEGGGLEADERSGLDVGDPPLGDQATDEPSPVRRYSAACPMVSNSSRCEA